MNILENFSSIRSKILLPIIIVSVITSSAIFAIVFYQTTQIIKEMSYNEVDEMGQLFANSVEIKLEKGMGAAQTLAQVLQGYHKIPVKQRRQVVNEMLTKILASENSFMCVWSVWEPNALDSLDATYINSEYSDETGRFLTCMYRLNGKILLSVAADYETPGNGDYYLIPRKLKKDVITEPYFYSYTHDEKDKILMTSLVSPILENGTFLGVAGIDIGLNDLYDIITTIKIGEKGYGALISNEGIIVAHPDTSQIGDSVLEHGIREDRLRAIKSVKNNQKYISTTFSESLGDDVLRVYVPFMIGNSTTPWALYTNVPVGEILKPVDKLRNFVFTFMVAGLLLQILVIIWIANNITKQLQIAVFIAQQVSEGKLDVPIQINSVDEAGQMLSAMKKMIGYLQEVGMVANRVANNDLEVEVLPISEHDVLNHALKRMITNLRDVVGNLKKSISQVERQNFISGGVAELGNKMRGEQDLKTLANSVITFLAQYLNMQIGAVYLKNHDQQLELIAFYAYHHPESYQFFSSIMIGEGLVGQSAKDKQIIHLKNIPPDYIKVQSAIGEKSPAHLLILPILYENQLIGVIELGSLNPIEPAILEYLKISTENIGIAFHTAQARQKMQMLLQNQTS